MQRAPPEPTPLLVGYGTVYAKVIYWPIISLSVLFFVFGVAIADDPEKSLCAQLVKFSPFLAFAAFFFSMAYVIHGYARGRILLRVFADRIFLSRLDPTDIPYGEITEIMVHSAGTFYIFSLKSVWRERRPWGLKNKTRRVKLSVTGLYCDADQMLALMKGRAEAYGIPFIERVSRSEVIIAKIMKLTEWMNLFIAIATLFSIALKIFG